MIYSPVYQYVYYCIPKTASTTLCDVLIRYFDGRVLQPFDRHDNRLPREMSTWFQFATVRHPYRRAVSGYRYINRKRDHPLPLAECWGRFHLISMTEYLSTHILLDRPATTEDYSRNLQRPLGTPLPCLTVWLRQENLEEDFAKLPFFRPVEFPRLQVGQVQCPTPDVRPGVHEFCREDFERFGYRRLPWL
jgi:hypothetical protein